MSFDQATLLRKYFFARTDVVAARLESYDPTANVPQPVTPLDFDGLLTAHLLGTRAPFTKVTYRHPNGVGASLGHYRIGSYAIHPDTNRVKWLCIDVDGGTGHGNAVADPESAARRIQSSFMDKGAPAYLEKSGGGHGWHVWVFFAEPVPAVKARQLAWWLVPKDIPLTDGALADPLKNRGIEIFPKQNSVGHGGFGNLVWLPWWHGAAPGGNQFYRETEGGTLAAYRPDDFDALTAERLDALVAQIPDETKHKIEPPPRVSTPFDGASANWQQWRREALARLPLENVYGPYLTGKNHGRGWLECRDPDSPSGDKNPSAAVADGSNPKYDRGIFHSYRSGRSMSPFDFMVEQGLARDHKHALQIVAGWTSVPLPELEQEPLPAIPENFLDDEEPSPAPEDPAHPDPWKRADTRKWYSQEPPSKQYLFADLLPVGIVGALLAEGGCGKTFWTLAAAQSLATGKAFFPSFRPTQPRRVMAFFGEDSEDEIWRRMRAISAQAGLTPDEIEGMHDRLWLLPGISEPLMVLDRSTPVHTDRFWWLWQLVQEWQPDLLVIDPKAQWDATDENSNAHATHFANAMRTLTRGGAGTVLLTHHVNKNALNDDAALSSAQGRGASGFRDACRWVANMRVCTPKAAKQINIPEEKRRFYVEFDVTKNNYSGVQPRPVWMHRTENGPLEEMDFGGFNPVNATLEWIAAEADAGRTYTANQLKEKKEGAAYRYMLKSGGASSSPEAVAGFLKACMELKTGGLVEQQECTPRGPGRKVLVIDRLDNF